MTNNTHNHTLGFCCAENNVLQVEPSLQLPIGLCLSFLPLNQHLGSEVEICSVFLIIWWLFPVKSFRQDYQQPCTQTGRRQLSKS
jgi:hypothetical protein